MYDKHSDVIAAIGNTRLAGGVGVGLPRVAAWKRRNSIPSRYLFPVAQFAQSLGISVTVEELAAMAADIPRPQPTQPTDTEAAA